MLEIKNCHEYIYVHDLDFPLMRETERQRDREREIWKNVFKLDQVMYVLLQLKH